MSGASVKITGARVAIDANESQRADVYIHNGRISFADKTHLPRPTLDLTGFLLLPGLINAHDHLEFNLFPKLGGSAYPNAKAWAEDIYRPKDSPVREQLRVPKRTRLMWGGLKNLFSGVTTVAHHNPWDERSFDAQFPINVVREFGWAHSLDFSPDLAAHFHATPPEWPFFLHAAEGVDEEARSEITRLEAMGLLSDRTVLIHAIGLEAPDLNLVKAHRTGVVWCPTSNLAVYGRTLAASVLGSGLNIALGTDSAMTAQTDLTDEIGIARGSFGLDNATLYEMVTKRAAALLRLREGQGEIRQGGVADIVAVPDRGERPADALAGMTPEMVMVQGRIRLIAPDLFGRLGDWHRSALYSVEVEGRSRWLTDLDMPALHEQTAPGLGPHYRLAGKRVSL
jgi:cytosine/adenosine deaminase-related metal-dependent hydrolase